ncbi:uncharacterized protein LOC114165238 [Vigna unguiculata]|uniref:uncharacterized protein LOC114165238 n=1 Tax=Vigna unguiculata TaxID=3917 RepID=UPI0010168E94|nr:uncharacterized protein LOC114165238 [Vigna unguiculata]
MVPYDEPIYGFSGEKVSIRGYIDLHTVFRDGTQTKTIPICFLVVDTPTSYNVLLGRPSLNTLGVVVSTPHLAMKFPSPSRDILTIHGDQRLARECYMASLRPQLPILQTKNIERPPDFHIALSGDDLDPRRAILTSTLISNTDLFAWSVADLPGVDPQVAVHKLSIYKEARYVSQKKRKLGEERRIATKIEANKLLNIAFIEEAHYTTWFSNVVLVKRLTGCPRDAYLLPNIDRLVDGVADNKVLTILDAYSGYNQIPMATTDMNKTAFITDDANYLYKVMSFGLKNA